MVGYLILAKKQSLKKINSDLEFAWNFGPSKNNFKKVFEVVKEAQKLENFSCIFKKNVKFPETAVLKLESSKAKRKINWSSKWNISVAHKKTIEWNRNIKKNISVENRCVQQFLSYINDK